MALSERSKNTKMLNTMECHIPRRNGEFFPLLTDRVTSSLRRKQRMVLASILPTLGSNHGCCEANPTDLVKSVVRRAAFEQNRDNIRGVRSTGRAVCVASFGFHA